MSILEVAFLLVFKIKQLTKFPTEMHNDISLFAVVKQHLLLYL